MENVNRDILRPIGTIIISSIGFLSILISFNKIFVGIVFGILIIDSIMAVNIAKKSKKQKSKK